MEPPTPLPQQIRPQEVNVGPLPAFDIFLRALGDSYLNFFMERLRLEEQYRDGMSRLVMRQRAVDQLFEERIPDRDWSLRRAWRDICDGLDRESEVRSAFINSLRADIVDPLQDLKETHERSRKRIKEDNKSSLAQYNDYIENTLPRLKRTYLKRSQEVDEWKHMGEPKPTTGPTSPIISNPVPLVRASMDGGTANGAGGGPNPERIRGRQSSIAIPGRRDRSPGSTISDLAHQGRRQLNNLRTLIETKGVTKEGGARSEAAMRVVRAKREADEADKEYRKGVHALETLRLRRVKTLEAGYNSLETLVLESAETMIKVLTRYGDNLTATNATNGQLSMSLGEVVHEIKPTQDLIRLRQLTELSHTAAIPKRILYYSYQVGECHDMLFGVSLVDYASSRGLKDNELPKIVGLCIAEMEARGMKTEGIYRVSGKHTTVMELSLAAEKNEANFQFDRLKVDVFCVGSLLKLYLRELPEPVFKFPQSERTQYTEDREKHFSNKFAMIRGKIRRLPPIHQATLRATLEHLAKVAANSKNNKMDAKNLAVVFGPPLLGEEPVTGSTDILMMSRDTLMEDLINNVRTLYDTPLTLSEEHERERDRAASPPLPNPPAEEQGTLNSRTNPAVYGSSHTVIKTLPASTTEGQPPKLPPRPAGRTIPRRATISSGSISDGAGTPSASTTAAGSGRPSEDGRSMNYVNARSSGGGLTVGTGTKPLRLETEMRSRSANASPVQTRSKGSSQNPSTSEVGLTTDTTNDVTTGGALYTPSTAASTTGHRPSRNNSSYANSLLMEPAVLMSQANESETSTAGGIKGVAPSPSPLPPPSPAPIATTPTPASAAVGGREDFGGGTGGLKGADEDEFEVDYPGSPDTSALDFKTAENTPITEALPLDAFTRP